LSSFVIAPTAGGRFVGIDSCRGLGSERSAALDAKVDRGAADWGKKALVRC